MAYRAACMATMIFFLGFLCGSLKSCNSRPKPDDDLNLNLADQTEFNRKKAEIRLKQLESNIDTPSQLRNNK